MGQGNAATQWGSAAQHATVPMGSSIHGDDILQEERWDLNDGVEEQEREVEESLGGEFHQRSRLPGPRDKREGGSREGEGRRKGALEDLAMRDSRLASSCSPPVVPDTDTDMDRREGRLASRICLQKQSAMHVMTAHSAPKIPPKT